VAALREMVEEVLARTVRPIVARDGGEVSVASVDETGGAVVLLYRGRCAGCPAIGLTHERIVRPAIEGSIPGIGAVTYTLDLGA